MEIREEYLENSCDSIVILGSEKGKAWGAICYGNLGELVIFPELIEVLKEGAKLDINKINELANNMPGKLLALIAANGEAIGKQASSQRLDNSQCICTIL